MRSPTVTMIKLEVCVSEKAFIIKEFESRRTRRKLSTFFPADFLAELFIALFLRIIYGKL